MFASIGNFIGKFVEEKYLKHGEKLLDEIDEGKTEETDKVGIKTIRALTRKWTNEAVMAANDKPDLLRHAWTNFGLYLPIDGSKDGDINTIVD